MLTVLQSRIDYLQSLLTDVEARTELGERTGIDLTLDVLQGIIEATQQERELLEREVKNLENSLEARNPAPVFQAEMVDAKRILNVSYGSQPDYVTGRGFY